LSHHFGHAILPGYVGTEVATVIFVNMPESNHPVSAGRPLPNRKTWNSAATPSGNAKPKAAIDEALLRAARLDLLEPHKVPRTFTFVDSLPAISQARRTNDS
jgi:hypothetical protein